MLQCFLDIKIQVKGQKILDLVDSAIRDVMVW